MELNKLYRTPSRKTFSQFVKFGIVGFSNTFIGYVVYILCVWSGMHYLLANVVGFFVSVLNAFYWSDRFVFKKGTNEQRGLWSSLMKTVLAYASTGIIAPLIILMITVPTNFVLNKYWSFKTETIDEENKCSDSLL